MRKLKNVLQLSLFPQEQLNPSRENCPAGEADEELGYEVGIWSNYSNRFVCYNELWECGKYSKNRVDIRDFKHKDKIGL